MIILTITFWSLTKCYWTAYALQMNSTYILSSKYHNQHVLLFISCCCWYELYTDIFKHKLLLNNIELHSLNEYCKNMCKKTQDDTRPQTCKCGLHINTRLQCSQLAQWWAKNSLHSYFATVPCLGNTTNNNFHSSSN